MQAYPQIIMMQMDAYMLHKSVQIYLLQLLFLDNLAQLYINQH